MDYHKAAFWQTSSLKREHGYYKLPLTAGLFTHKTCPIWFMLLVDDFGIKYVRKQHADHLLCILKEFYKVEEDWNGELYCGITIDWHYDEGYVNISMPNYVHKQLVKYKWAKPKRPQFCPFKPNPIRYGKQSDRVDDDPESPLLDKKGKKNRTTSKR